LYLWSQRAGADGDAKCADLKLALNNCAAAAVSLRVDVHKIHLKLALMTRTFLSMRHWPVYITCATIAGNKGQAKKHNQLPFRALVKKDFEVRQIIITEDQDHQDRPDLVGPRPPVAWLIA